MTRVTYGVIPLRRTGDILTGIPFCWASSIWPSPEVESFILSATRPPEHDVAPAGFSQRNVPAGIA